MYEHVRVYRVTPRLQFRSSKRAQPAEKADGMTIQGSGTNFAPGIASQRYTTPVVFDTLLERSCYGLTLCLPAQAAA